MKRVLALIFAFMVLSCSLCFAMFLDESDAYEKVRSDMSSSTYLNVDALSIQRYEPPFYIIRGEIISYVYTESMAVDFTYDFYYNYSTKTVKMKNVSAKFYNQYGHYLGRKSASDTLSYCSPNSIAGMVANRYFSICYGIPFY